MGLYFALTWLLWPAIALGSIQTDSSEAGFAGTDACAACHQEEARLWRQSHHAHAMAEATADTVLGDFSGREITVHGVTSRFTRRGDRFFVTTDGPDGKIAEFEISHTFGFDPLQQYLVGIGDGRLQALGLAWDTRPVEQGGQRWFHLYPDEKIDHRHELHWTGPQQNWNYMCADCHSTNLVKGYDAVGDRFDTTWSEISVGCESCHGPGTRHIEWATALKHDGQQNRQNAKSAGDGATNNGLVNPLRDQDGATWVYTDDSGIARRTVPRSSDSEVQVCATCHSRRGTLRPGASTGSSFLGYHMPAFLIEPLYHVDGQILDEVYVWGSFLQSKMYQHGVTCSDCHDPHGGNLRLPGDGVCATCHLEEKFATSSHHGHPEDSAGADCLGCHMPEKTYMQVDPRRDHSLRPPRPDQSLVFGTPNACSQCHADRSVEWAADAFERLFPETGKPFQHWTRAFSQARQDMPQAEVSLLRVIEEPVTPDIVRATAVLELAGHLGPLSQSVLARSLRDDSALVRIAALRTLEALPPDGRMPMASHLLEDPLLAVRIEAARVLGVTPGTGLSADSRKALRQALMDYFESQEFNADRPESRVNLGNLQSQVGSLAVAESYYLKAIELDPNFSPAYLNLADLYRSRQQEPAAVDILEAGLGYQPGDAALHHALGLALVRAGRLPRALKELEEATELDPSASRYAYVLGIALNSAGEADRAIEVLESAWKNRPYDRDILFGLATIERDRGQYEIARAWADKLVENNPVDPGAKQLLESIEAAAAK